MPVELPYRLMPIARGFIWLARLEVLILFAYLALQVGTGLHLIPEGLAKALQLDRASVVLLITGVAGAGVLYLLAIYWQHHAVANAQALIPDRRRIKPLWAVIWWIIPVLNLVQPVRSMSQTWNTSVDNDRNPNGPAAPAVTGWWLCLLASPVPVLMSPDRSPTAIAYSVALFIASLLALITIVRRVSRAQVAASAERNPVAPETAAANT